MGMSRYVTVPISTEGIELNPDCAFSTAYEDGVLMITVDTRCQNVHQRLGLSTKTRLHWGKDKSFEAQYPKESLDHLLCDPLGRRVLCGIKINALTSVVPTNNSQPFVLTEPLAFLKR